MRNWLIHRLGGFTHSELQNALQTVADFANVGMRNAIAEINRLRKIVGEEQINTTTVGDELKKRKSKMN